MSVLSDSAPPVLVEPKETATSRRRAVLLYILALLLTASMFGWLMYEQYQQELAAAEARMEARAGVVDQWTQGVLGKSEQALFSLTELVTLFESLEGVDRQALEEAVEQLARYVPSVDEMVVLDATGRVVLGSNERYQGTSYSDSDFFQAFRDSELTQEVTTLQRSPENEAFYLYNGKRLENALGEFAGIVVSRIKPQIFAEALLQLSMGEGESIALIDSDFQLVARHSQPAWRVTVGQHVAMSEQWEPLEPEEYARTFRMRSPIDQHDRLYRLERIGDYPMYAVIGIDLKNLFSGWRDRACLLAILLVVIALLGAWGLRHYLNRLTLANLLQARIEEREAARAHAREREIRLDALVNSLQDLIFVFDEQGLFRHIHAIDQRLLLVDPNEALGKHYATILTQELTEAFSAVFERVRRFRQVETFEYSLVVNGHHCCFHSTVSPLTDVSKTFSGVLAVVRDITEDKRLQEELQLAAAAFQTHLGVLITDHRGYILKTNDTFKRITGYSDADMIGKTPQMFSSGQHGATFYEQLWQRVNQTGNWEGEIWNKRKNGELFPEWITISAIHDDTGKLSHYVATISDISERKAAEQEIHQLAFYDPLTGLTNRRLFMDRLETALKELNRHQRYGALMLFDIDNFKELNDTQGYHAGDQLLQGVARRLSQALRDTDTLARLGADEFAVLIEGVDSGLAHTHHLAKGIAHKLMTTLGEPIRVNEGMVAITVSAGVTMMSSDQQSVDDYLQQADMALSQAKGGGRQTLRFFNPHMQAELLARVRLESDLRHAVMFKQWQLYYQPQVDPQGVLTGVEVLLRWDHAERGIVSPGEFMPLLETTGLINEVGEWILEQACWQLVEWASHPVLGQLTLSVNISPMQFREATFVERVESLFARTKAPLQQLKLEVTESLFVEAPSEVRETMLRLKAQGVRFSLDDFGTGYSSLAYLAQLPLDQLKVDQSFVRQVLESCANAAIVESTIALAKSLNLDVIAEGVETREQYDWLFAHGCLAYQGYLFGRPMPVAELTEQALGLNGPRQGTGAPEAAPYLAPGARRPE